MHDPDSQTLPSLVGGVREQEETCLLRWDGLVLLALAMAASLFYWFAHARLHGFYHGMGIGLTLTHWILTGAVLIFAGRRHVLRVNPAGLFLLVLSMLLSAAYGVFANTRLRLLNLPVLVLTTAQALFGLTGQNGCPLLSGRGLWEGFRRYFVCLFHAWKVPFRAAGKRRLHRGGDGQLVLGAFAACAAAFLALSLLSSADMVFGSLISSAAERVTRVDGGFLLKVLMAFLLGLTVFSGRFSLLQAPAEIRAVPPAHPRPVAFCFALSALTLVYGLFAYVQIRYLFAGVESVRMSGGYAAYARSGFFQLVLVALLTLLLLLPALTFCPKSRTLRLLGAAVSVLTVVIDVSAFFRMRLYIGAYGLTTLRVLTLWGIAVILLALLAALAKAVRPDLRICPFLAAAVLTAWVVLNWVNVDRLVAQNLVSRYNAALEAGGVMDVRIDDLASDSWWSPDYYAAFEKIADPQARADALALLDMRGNETDEDGRLRREPLPYDWSLSFAGAPAVRGGTE